METKCELIKDLLPLYLDGLCSDYTKSVVNKHITGCADCKILLDTLNEQNKSPINAQVERKKINPLRKIKKRNRIITIVSIACAILIVSILYVKLFQIGSVAPMSAIIVENVEMFDDKMTFSLELSSSNSSNKIVRTADAQADGSYIASQQDLQSGNVYVKTNIALAWPLHSKGSYKMTFGFDEGALGSDSIKAIYLVGKDENDIKLIWEAK